MVECRLSIEHVAQTVSDKTHASLAFALIGHDTDLTSSLRAITGKENSPMKFQALAKLILDLSLRNPENSQVLEVTKGNF